LFNMFVRKQSSCSQVMAMLNALLYTHGGDQFVTAFYGIMDFSEGTLTYCNAGHNHPYIMHQDGSLETLDFIGGVALGIGDPDSRYGTYAEETVKIGEGDCLFLYTDGVNEAMNPTFEMFGIERMEETLKKYVQDSTKVIGESIVNEIKEFVQDMPQSDDITMLIIKYAGIKK